MDFANDGKDLWLRKRKVLLNQQIAKLFLATPSLAPTKRWQTSSSNHIKDPPVPPSLPRLLFSPRVLLPLCFSLSFPLKNTTKNHPYKNIDKKTIMWNTTFTFFLPPYVLYDLSMSLTASETDFVFYGHFPMRTACNFSVINFFPLVISRNSVIWLRIIPSTSSYYTDSSLGWRNGLHHPLPSSPLPPPE